MKIIQLPQITTDPESQLTSLFHETTKFSET